LVLVAASIGVVTKIPQRRVKISSCRRRFRGALRPLTAQNAARFYPWPRKGEAGEPGREPINSEWLADVRFGAHSGLKSDIAPCPLCALYPQRPKRPCRANRANRRGRERLAYAAARRLAETLRLPSLSALAGPLVRPSAEGCGRVATVPFFLRRKAFCDSRLLLALCKSISAGGGSFIAN
jgi:hypothetical protein